MVTAKCIGIVVIKELPMLIWRLQNIPEIAMDEVNGKINYWVRQGFLRAYCLL